MSEDGSCCSETHCDTSAGAPSPAEAPGEGALTPAQAARWLRLALYLVIGTAAYNLVEAGLALWAGIEAQSVALVGFGLDSVVELFAAGVVLWRLWVQARGAQPEVVALAEARVRRWVGGSFFALAAYVTVQASYSLWIGQGPEESLWGVILTGASAVIMPLVAWGKLKAARALGSGALRAEALETLACTWLSITLLLGLGAHALLGWWWLDAVAALAMVPWLIKEGREGFEEEACGCHGGLAEAMASAPREGL